MSSKIESATALAAQMLNVDLGETARESASFKRACVAYLLAQLGYITEEQMTTPLGLSYRGVQNCIATVKCRIQASPPFAKYIGALAEQLKCASPITARFAALRRSLRGEFESSDMLSATCAMLVLAEVVREPVEGERGVESGRAATAVGVGGISIPERVGG